MNVLLIGPSLFKAGDMTYITPPLGILSLAAVLRAEGCTVKVFDTNLRANEELEKLLDEEKFDMVGIGSLWDSIALDSEISHIVRRKQEPTLIIMGGYSATFTPQQLLTLSAADVLVFGEGERPIKQLQKKARKLVLKHPLDSIDALHLSDIDGLIINYQTGIKETAGNIRLTDKELTALPTPAFDLVNYRDYWNVLKKHENVDETELYTIRIAATRGCNESCLFCCSTRFFDKARDPNAKFVQKKPPFIRFISPEKVIAIIAAAIKPYPEIRTIFFNDDNFNADSKYTIRVCKQIIKAKDDGEIPKDLTFTCFGRIDNANAEVLGWMKKAGFRLICYGIESGSDHVLKTIGKRFTMKQVMKGLEETQKSGVKAYSWIIVLTPKSNIEDVLATINFVIDCESRGIDIGLYLSMVPFPGTPMTIDAEKKGLIRYADENICAEAHGKVHSIPRGTAILPEDRLLREVYYGANEAFEQSKAEFMSRHPITHLPRKTLTYIWLHSLIISLSTNTNTDLSSLRQKVLDIEPRI